MVTSAPCSAPLTSGHSSWPSSKRYRGASDYIINISSSHCSIPYTLAPTVPDGPSTSAVPSQHISIPARDFLTFMDAVCTFSATSTSLMAAHTTFVERMIPLEAAVGQNHAILVQMQSHLGLPPFSPLVPTQAFSIAAADFLPAHPATPQPSTDEDGLPPATHH